jgi:predicted nucleic acid-binding protein
MTHVFADTGYWIALLSPRDDLHLRAKEIAATLTGVQVVTSEWVLIEVLNGFAGRGQHLRSIAGATVSALRASAGAVVVPQTDEAFSEALKLYRETTDKQLSLTDCSSFLIMRKRGIDSALTPDHHFEQANFKALLR